MQIVSVQPLPGTMAFQVGGNLPGYPVSKITKIIREVEGATRDRFCIFINSGSQPAIELLISDYIIFWE